MSDHAAGGNGHTDTHGGGKTDSIWASIWTIPAIIILIVVFKLLFFSGNTDKDNKKENNQSSQKTEVRATHFKTIHVSIGPNSYVKINPSYGVQAIRYTNATTKYCVKNSAEKHCSIDTEDISGLFINERSIDNLQIFLKSQGEIGSVDVELEYE